VTNGQLTAGHARTLITAEDPAALAKQIIDGGLSVREAEQLSQQKVAAKRPTTPAEAEPKDADTVALEKRLSDVLGLKVIIDHRDSGGKLEIRYRTLEQLDSVITRLDR
jgi:ParB family chromosome partitioning protein